MKRLVLCNRVYGRTLMVIPLEYSNLRTLSIRIFLVGINSLEVRHLITYLSIPPYLDIHVSTTSMPKTSDHSCFLCHLGEVGGVSN